MTKALAQRSPLDRLIDQACQVPRGVPRGASMMFGGPPLFPGSLAELMAALDGLSERQRDVLGWAMLGEGHLQEASVLAELCERKMIIPFRDSASQGDIRIGVELRTHMAWCEWCAKHYDDEGNFVA